MLADLLLNPRDGCWPAVLDNFDRSDDTLAIEVALHNNVDFAADAKPGVSQLSRLRDRHPRSSSLPAQEVDDHLEGRRSSWHAP